MKSLNIARACSICIYTVLILFGTCSCTTKEGQVEFGTGDKTVEYNRIKAGSLVEWKASHLGGVEPRFGEIYCEEVTILVTDGVVSHVEALIDMASLTLENLQNDEAEELADHLKSADFFDIEKHPLSRFEMTKLIPVKGDYTSKVTGNLTILGVSNSVSFYATIEISEKEVSMESEEFVIDRSAWGLAYHSEGALGVPVDYLISNEVGFKIYLKVLKTSPNHE
jgi:polyisoprenoid-binding protein YceI